MDSTGRALLNLLFREDEHICVSDTHFACKSIPFKEVLENDWITLVSNNPEVPDKKVRTSDLILASVNPMKPQSDRLDVNVSNFRTFLIEIDIGTLKEQINTLDHIGIPWSAQIFSGGKSIHTVITLDEDLPNERSYRYLAKWMFNIISSADKNCVNPSRCVRIPGAYRDNDKKQRLRSIKGPVTIKELKDWLNKFPNFRPVVKKNKPPLTGIPVYDKLSEWTKNQIKYGLKPKKGRNQNWYGIFCDFLLAGYSEEQAIDILRPIFTEEWDFKEREWLSIAKSAFKRQI